MLKDLKVTQQEDEDEDEEEGAEDKSIYQTFMHVSSIFSKPFGGKLPKKSRFFNEEDQEEEDEEPNAQSSIFSSSGLFSNNKK